MAKKDNDKVTCQYCEKEFSKSGITNHEKACPQNPENIVEEVKEVEVVEEVLEKVAEEAPEVKEAPEERFQEEKSPELVEIRLAEKIECYIGNRYYRYKKGETDRVPVEVKDILKRAGLLEAY